MLQLVIMLNLIKYCNTYFNQTFEERYVPRWLIIDTDSSTIDNIIRGELGNLFDPNSINFEDYDTEHLFTNANFRCKNPF